MKIFTTGQVAQKWGVAPSAVRKWLNSGQIKSYCCHSTQERLISRQDLFEFLQSDGMSYGWPDWSPVSYRKIYDPTENEILGGIFGLAIADALGVPVEFQSRESLRCNPVTDMRGYGTYNQPPGTWSDDTSLTLCLLESLTKKVSDTRWACSPIEPQPDYTDIMQRFMLWVDKGEYTAHGEVFDVGIATRKALQRFKEGIDPLKCGGTSKQDNGNGSLMRILPIIFYLRTIFEEEDLMKEEQAIDIIHNVSSLTHAHKRSQIACGIYLIIAGTLLGESSDIKSTTYSCLQKAKEYYEGKEEYAEELKHYNRLFKDDFAKLPETEIKSSGYVVDTLEAALWCLLNTKNYKDCVLKAVNLGDDTDTVAAIAGGLAGIHYGVYGIPKEWREKLACVEYITMSCGDFCWSLNRCKIQLDFLRH